MFTIGIRHIDQHVQQPRPLVACDSLLTCALTSLPLNVGPVFPMTFAHHYDRFMSPLSGEALLLS